MLVIIGPTGSGKSTLAQRIANQCDEDVSIVSAGQWARKQFGITEHTPEAGAKLWELTQAYLKDRPNAVKDWLVAQQETCRPLIYEGLRSADDLVAITKDQPYILVNVQPNTIADDWEQMALSQLRKKAWQHTTPHFEICFPFRTTNDMMEKTLADYLLVLYGS